MATFLFDSIIFGPVWSRRLGESLGINLLPVNRKVCNFSCVYCECGLTPADTPSEAFPDAMEVRNKLIMRLKDMKQHGEYLDSITFAGNGEPTLHPDFPRIISETVEIRNQYFPGAKIAVLSNATMIGEPGIFKALQKADQNILKLDSAFEETLKNINCPRGNYHLSETINMMKRFKGALIIQTLFFRGSYNGKQVDNTTTHEIEAWLNVLDQLRPESVMIYSLARDTAVEGLEGISRQKLEEISSRVEQIGITTQVTP